MPCCSRAARLVAASGAALLLTACASATQPADTGGSPDSSAASSPTSSAADSGSSPGGAGQSTSAAGKCTSANLSVSLRDVSGNDQHEVTLAWTNTSARPCTMYGYGGVDLRGPNDPTFGPTYELPRSTIHQAATVRLAPGGTAHTTITFLSPDPASAGQPGSVVWVPTQAVVTPPDETHSKTVTWTYGPVLRQDAATHPGTYIGPVTAD